MTADILTALIGFAFVSSITPGPNNLMLMASGANFGMRRTLPHMLGISLGHAFMMTLVGLGLGRLFLAYPLVKSAMLVACLGYLLYLSWKIGNAAAPGDGKAGGRPLTFLEAAGFQWINPKGWYMALTAITAYMPETMGHWGAPLVSLVFAATNFPSILIWAGLGTQVRRLLTDHRKLRAFNWTMAGLLLLTLAPILRDLW